MRLPQISIENSDSSDKPKKDNVVLNLMNEFGGPLAIVAAAETVLSFAGGLSKNKTYQNIINGFKMTVPAILIGYKVYNTIETFYENKSHKNVNIVKNHKILKLMGVSPFQYDTFVHKLSSDPFKIGADVSHWLLKSPKVKSFEIQGYCDETFEMVDVINFDKGTYYIPIKVSASLKFVIEIEILGFVNNKLMILNSNIFYLNHEWEPCLKLKKDIIVDFVDNFNTAENTIIYNTNGIDIRPKIKVEYDINQFDVYNLAEEIKSVMIKKRKRGYIFAGVPGTGKSSILLKLESLLTEYPIVYISKSSINYSGDLNEVFTLINTLSPCVAIFEDLDCFGFGNKSSKFFNEFLQEIDNVYEKYHTVIIATLNDSSQVHHSIINRPGRFDQVFLINAPQTVEEVYTVMASRCLKSSGEKLMPFENFELDLFNKIIEYKFTQADICELVEKILIKNLPFNNESLIYSIGELKNSKNAIKSCNFTNLEGEVDEDGLCYDPR